MLTISITPLSFSRTCCYSTHTDQIAMTSLLLNTAVSSVRPVASGMADHSLLLETPLLGRCTLAAPPAFDSKLLECPRLGQTSALTP